MYYNFLNLFRSKYIFFKKKSKNNNQTFLIDKNEYVILKTSLLDSQKSEKKTQSLVGISKNKTDIIKIEFLPHPRRKNSLLEEASIVSYLNKNKCVSSPKIIEFGTKHIDTFKPVNFKLKTDTLEFSYIQYEFIDDCQKVNLSDLLLAIIEQQSFGVFQGDIKPTNIIFNGKNLFLVDYDQAEYLDKNITLYDSEKYIDWTLNKDFEKYGVSNKGWVRNFSFLDKLKHFRNLFSNSKLNLIGTSYYKNQNTTNSKNGAYHSLNENSFFVEGIRDLDERTKILDKITFYQSEKVLDIGSNVGILSHYLYKRGCVVSGYEMDSHIINAAKIISNILGYNIEFKAQDIDDVPVSEYFDTICLFSVIHHTKNFKQNCINISNSCSRIIIECRLYEYGKKPIKKNNKIKWIETSKWNFDSLDELYPYLENIFPNFKFIKNHGECDKGRYIIELKK